MSRVMGEHNESGSVKDADPDKIRVYRVDNFQSENIGYFMKPGIMGAVITKYTGLIKRG